MSFTDIELTRADDWLYSTLSGDAQLATAIGAGGSNNIWNALVPQGIQTANPSYTFIIFHNQSNGAEHTTINGTTEFVEVVYLVQAFKEVHDFGPLAPVAARIHALLHKQSGGTVLSCVRERSYKQLERTEAGKIVAHLGGFYRIFVQ